MTRLGPAGARSAIFRETLFTRSPKTQMGTCLLARPVDSMPASVAGRAGGSKTRVLTGWKPGRARSMAPETCERLLPFRDKHTSPGTVAVLNGSRDRVRAWFGLPTPLLRKNAKWLVFMLTGKLGC